MPDDRLTSEEAEKKLPKPEVYIVKNGEAVFKPGMKTWFVESRKKQSKDGSGVVHGQSGTVVGGTVCTCDKVCTCQSVKTCSCQRVRTCSCQRNYGTYCSCNKICTCVPVT